MRLTIGKKIGALLLLMVLTAVTNILVIYYYQNLQKYDSRIVNIAGRQRMLSQKISKLALSIANGNDSDRQLLSDAIGLYNSSLKILQHGGRTKKGIIPSAPGIMEDLFGKKKDAWGLFKKSAEIIVTKKRGNPLFSEAIQYIQQKNDELLRASDEVTGMFDRIFSKKVSHIKTLLFFLLGFDVFIFIIGCIMATNLARPIRILSELAKRIGEGDFSQKIVIPRPKDEIRDLANAFDKMTDNLETLRERQTQLMHTGRLTSLGEMAGNVAHEIGNPLSSMSALIQILDSGKVSKEEQVSYVSLLKQLVDRIDRTLRRLVTFSKPSPPKLESLDLKQVIEEAVRITPPDARFKKITIDKRLARDIPEIRGDRDQLVQVFVNLLLNAADEISADGRITIETKYDRESEGVMVLFSDNGHGIPPEALPKVFDPFYTTKAPGKGTGLGLSICRSIIEELRGKIGVESKVGKGTTFTLTLPIGDKTNLTKTGTGESP